MIEDDAAVAEVLGSALGARGYRVRIAATGRAGLELASEDPPDLVLLDLGLPDVDGVVVCRELRRWSRNPIIVITADGTDHRKVAALDEGADDYVTKPFSTVELLARLRVAERHRAVLASVVDDRLLRSGDLWVDVGAHQAGVGDRALGLTPKEFALLALLVRNDGRVLTHRTLLEQIWGPGQEIATLRTHMTQLRRKLSAAGSVADVLTEPGVGYRLVWPE